MLKAVKKLSFFLFIFVAMGLSNCFCLLAQETADGSRLLKSNHFKIYCYPGVDIEAVNARVILTFYDALLDSGLKLSQEESAEAELARKFDLILYKVEEILDMYPRKMDLKIKIYKDQKQLNRAYYQVFNRRNRAGRISYYIHKYETVYTTEEAIRQGVLAHELTHAVCDHYFLVRPSVKISEFLAQYVEMHLED